MGKTGIESVKIQKDFSRNRGYQQPIAGFLDTNVGPAKQFFSISLKKKEDLKIEYLGMKAKKVHL